MSIRSIAIWGWESMFYNRYTMSPNDNDTAYRIVCLMNTRTGCPLSDGGNRPKIYGIGDKK